MLVNVDWTRTYQRTTCFNKRDEGSLASEITILPCKKKILSIPNMKNFFFGLPKWLRHVRIDRKFDRCTTSRYRQGEFSAKWMWRLSLRAQIRFPWSASKAEWFQSWAKMWWLPVRRFSPKLQLHLNLWGASIRTDEFWMKCARMDRGTAECELWETSNAFLDVMRHFVTMPEHCRHDSTVVPLT